MAFNLMAGAVSATILKSRGVPNDKVIAGAAVSAMTPGILGFVIPLVMARQFGGTAASLGGGSGKSGKTVDLTEAFQSVFADMAAVTQYAKVWDVKLDAGTVDTLLRQSQLLGLGEITPEQFATEVDTSVKQYLSSR